MKTLKIGRDMDGVKSQKIVPLVLTFITVHAQGNP